MALYLCLQLTEQGEPQRPHPGPRPRGLRGCGIRTVRGVWGGGGGGGTRLKPRGLERPAVPGSQRAVPRGQGQATPWQEVALSTPGGGGPCSPPSVRRWGQSGGWSWDGVNPVSPQAGASPQPRDGLHTEAHRVTKSAVAAKLSRANTRGINFPTLERLCVRPSRRGLPGRGPGAQGGGTEFPPPAQLPGRGQRCLHRGKY